MFSSLSVIIPTFNEESRISQTICDIFNKANKATNDLEIIVVDDGSTDRTVDKIKIDFFSAISSGVLKILSIKHGGKGAAVKVGILEAKKEWVLFMDADNSASFDQLHRFFSFVNFDIVIGSREVDSGLVRRVEEKRRKTTGRLFNFAVRKLFGLPWLDTQCGFKLFKKEAAERIFRLVKEEGFVFDVEVLLLAKRINVNVKEVGIDWYKSGQTSVRLLRDGLKMFLVLFRIKKRWSKHVF